MEPATEQFDQWSWIKKLAFRFFFIYLTLYIFLNNVIVFPFIGHLYYRYIKPFHIFAAWIGKHILRLTKPIMPNNRGNVDTIYDNIIIVIIILCSIIGIIVWSIVDKKKINYNKLFYWFIVALRYYVAIAMLLYSFYKFFELQFGFPSLEILTRTYGELSPREVAWNFLGYSTAYNYFMGIVEISCFLLLFYRKTSLLGALTTLIVGIYIMAISYSYDVCVKQFATHLVIMALFLVSKDSGRLINFFILNKPSVSSNVSYFYFKKKWINIALKNTKYLLIVYVIIFDLYKSIQLSKLYGSHAQKPPLYGVYDVKKFIINKDILKPLTTDTFRWDKLIISHRRSAYIKFMNDSTKGFVFNVDTVTKKIIMNKRSDTIHKYYLTYTISKKDSLIFKGTYEKDSIQIAFHKLDINKFPLVSQGFHWINEYPYSR